MSKNTNLSFLTDFLTADIVNSRVGMNNVSPQSTFDVTGTGKFSGILTLGSTVSNGTYTYTLPSATGTLALTSDIPVVTGYVPYTGATTSVDLGNNVLTSRGLNIDSIGGTAGALNLRQATSFSTWSGAPFTSIYATTGNRVVFSFSNDNRSFTLDGSLVSAASPRTFTFPDATGTFALTSQIPTNAVGGTGTLNTIPKFTAGSTIGNSNIFDSGSIIYNTNPAAGTFAWQFGGSTVTGQSYGAQVVAGTNASDIGFKVMNAAASINYLVVRGDGLVTLTGALNGTSATFTGTALLGGASATNPLSIRTANGESYLRFLNADGTTYGDLERSITGSGAVRITTPFFRVTGTLETQAIIASARIEMGASSYIYGSVANGFRVLNNANTVALLNITDTGEATFSVNTNASLLITNSGQTPILSFRSNGVTAAGRIRVDEAFGGGEMVFSTKTTGGVDTDRMWIGASGNVGIGTASPKGKFDVFRAAGGSGTAAIVISNGEGGGGRNWSLNTEVVTAGDFGICQSTTNGGTPSPTAANTKFYITSAGNVGIGTTSPTQKLVVEGSAAILSVVDNRSFATGVGGALYLLGNYRSVGDVTVAGYIQGSKVNSTDGDYGFNLIFGTQTYTGGVSEKMRITSSGNLLIGTTTDSGQGKLQVNGRVYGDGFRSSSQVLGFFKNSTGSFDWEIGSDSFVGTGMYMYNSANGYVFRLTAAGVLTTSGGGTSDRRTKEDINSINESVLSFINELNPVSFKFINDVNKKTRRGFIAQEVLETSIPDLVLGDGDKQGGTYGLDYDGILALAIKAIQEQQVQIQELKNKLS